MKVLREFESHRFRQKSFSPNLKQPQKPALCIALAGFLMLKRYQVISAKLASSGGILDKVPPDKIHDTPKGEIMSQLTEMAIKKAKPEAKDYKMTDGGGLYLLVKDTGSKFSRLKYRIGGKEKLLAIGIYPDVSLSQARERREEARKLLANGGDPSAIKKAAKQAVNRALQVASDGSLDTES